MKHSKANTNNLPIFVKDTDSHEARIQTLDETHLAFVYGGDRYLPTDGVVLDETPWYSQITDTLWGILGLTPCEIPERIENLENSYLVPWVFRPVSLLTNVLLTAGLVTTTKLITKQIANSDKNNPKTTKK